jgi:hypothetical protein
MLELRRPDVRYCERDEVKPSNMLKASVEDYARDVARFAKFDNGDDPSRIAQRLGGRIHYHELDAWASESGSIFVHAPSDFDIILSTFTSPLRDRFTVAHELGHYFLHSNQGEVPIIALRQGTGRLEWEANWFAASLSMPAGAFVAIWNSSNDISRVASYFGVSEDAARVRRNALCPD